MGTLNTGIYVEVYHNLQQFKVLQNETQVAEFAFYTKPYLHAREAQHSFAGEV